MDTPLPKGTLVTVRTTNGGEITLPLAVNYRPTYSVWLDNGTPEAIQIYMMRVVSVTPAGVTP